VPVGAYAGPAKLMDQIAPLGPVYQAGTLSGNPLAMAAGVAMLSHLKSHPDIYTQLNSRTLTFCEAVLAAAQRASVDLVCNRRGSMFTFFFRTGDSSLNDPKNDINAKQSILDWETASASDTARFGKFHTALLDNGVYWPPSQYEAAFMGAAHGDTEIEHTVTAIAAALKNC